MLTPLHIPEFCEINQSLLTFVPLWWLIKEEHYVLSIIDLELLLYRVFNLFRIHNVKQF